jgi:hypothetical protein
MVRKVATFVRLVKIVINTRVLIIARVVFVGRVPNLGVFVVLGRLVGFGIDLKWSYLNWQARIWVSPNVLGGMTSGMNFHAVLEPDIPRTDGHVLFVCPGPLHDTIAMVEGSPIYVYI